MLGLPGVPALLVGAVLGRLAYGVLPVAVFLSLLRTTGSLAQATALASAQGLVASLAFPLKGRLVDRFGVAALRWPALLCLLTAVLGVGASGPAATAAVLLGVGLTGPPVTSTVRAGWGRRVPTALQDTAFALDAAVEEVAYLVGPAVGGALVVVTGDREAVIVAAALLVAAVLLLGTTRPEPAARRTRARLGRRTWSLAVLFGAVALAQGLLGAALAAVAARLGDDSLYGVLLTAEGVGALAGLAAAGRVGPGSRPVVLALAGPLLSAPLLLSQTQAPALLCAFSAGLPTAAVAGLLNARVTRVEEPARWNAAYGLTVTAQNLATVAGFAAGGLLVAPLGTGGPVVVAVALLVAAAPAVARPVPHEEAGGP